MELEVRFKTSVKKFWQKNYLNPFFGTFRDKIEVQINYRYGKVMVKRRTKRWAINIQTKRLKMVFKRKTVDEKGLYSQIQTILVVC